MAYRYIGNKTRIADTITDVISRHVPRGARIADPMCGTASMAWTFRRHGFKVTASDQLTFATHHARARLLLDQAPAFAGIGSTYEEILNHLNNLAPVEGLFWNEYGPDGSPSAGTPARQYFSATNAAKLDAIRQQLKDWAPALTENENALLRHDLVLATNDIANIAGTYGHFRATWSRSALRPLVLQPTTFSRGNAAGHVVLQGRIEDLAGTITADACYLDPPYMKRQYAANYHILETLARGDEPEAVGVSGLRNWWDQYSDFCSKRKIFDAFGRIFTDMDCGTFFISYSEDGLIDSSTLAEAFSQFGHVTRYDIPHQRFKSNAGGEGGQVTEYLFVLERQGLPLVVPQLRVS